MASIYEERKTSIYEAEDIPEGLAENVATPKAAYTVLASGTNSPNTPNEVAEVEQELTVDSVSQREREITARSTDEFQKSKRDLTLEIAKSDASAEDRVQAAEDVQQVEYEPSLVKEAVVNQGAQFDPRDETERKVHSKRVEETLLKGLATTLLENEEVRQAVSDLQQEVVLELGDGGLAESSAEVVEAISLPGVTGELYNSVAQDLFPEETNTIKNFVLPGETQVFLRDKFQSMSKEEQLEMLPVLKESLVENAGIATDNGFLAMTLINEVFSEELGIRGREDFDWDRLWNNVTGVLDTTVVLGTAARAGFKLTKARSVGKVVSAVDKANPQAARNLRAALLSSQDTRNLEKLSGLTPEDAAIDMYPTFRGALNANIPANIAEELVNAQTNLKKIEEDLAFGINYTQEEILQMQNRVKDAYDEINGSYNQSFSQFQVLEDEGRGFTIKAAIGPSPDTGFDGYQSALRHFQDNFGEGTQVDFLVRDGDVVREATRDELWGLQDAEVWYRVEKEYQYNVGLADENALLFGGQPIDKANALTEVSRGLSRFALDPASRFDRLTAKAASRANDLGQAVQGRMFNEFKQGFLSLPKGSQQRVIDAIDEGSKLEKNFTYDDLVGMGLNEKEILGYYKTRGIMDLEWDLNNTRVYNTLKRDGYESVVNYTTGFEEFGRRLSQGQAESLGRTKVFDPDQNRIVTLSADDVANLYSNGGQILKSKSVLKSGDEGVTYIAAGLGDGTRIRPLTENPLQYRPGYVTRFYDENYFVKMRRTEMVDGAKSERLVTVAAAPTNAEAIRLVDALKKQNPDADFVKVLDQKLDQQAKFDTEFEYLHRTGGIITGRRGDILKGTDEASAKTIDPVQSMMDSITYTAQRISHDDTIASLERRWVNTYGKRFGQHKAEGRHLTVPDNLNDIRGDTPSAKGLQEAKDHAAYIQALKGAQGDAANAWRSSMITLAEHIDNVFDGGRKAKAVTDLVRNFNPMKTLRGFTFNLLLASNPTRQLLLQANQISFLTGINPKYIAGGGLARDFTAFSMAAATRSRPIWGEVRPRLAKLMKMSEKDFETLYDGYVRSGLPQSIDSHTFARDGLQDISRRISGNAAQRAGRFVGNSIKRPILATKAVGFDMGEWSNLTMTWLVAWRDWQRKNPGRNWRTKAAMDDFSTEARDLSLNMTRTGELPYQRGFLSLSTQFLSYQHKALLALAGKNKAYASLTKGQRVGLLAGQFLLYGADGFGLGATWEKVKDTLGYDIPEPANNILDGLVYEYMLNSSINALTQDGTDIDFSSALAPGSGVLGSFNDFIGSLMTMDLPSTFLGASATGISRVDQAVRTVGTVWEIPDLTTDEQLKATLQQAGQIFGGYSNWVKGQAMKHIGYAVNKNGQPLYKVTASEGLFKSLFGINPESQEDYYRILQEMRGQFTGEKFLDTVGGPSDSDIDEIAETYYDRVLKIFREMSYDDIDGRDDLWYNQLQAKIALENTVMAVLPKDVAYAVRRRIHDRIDRNINTTGVDDLVQHMTRAVIGGTEARSTREHYVNMIRNADFKLTDNQMRDVEALIDYMTDTEGLE